MSRKDSTTSRAQKIYAMTSRRISVTVELTPEEYEDLVQAVIEKRGAQIDRTSPVIHYAVEFDVRLELELTILKFIGHEGRPSLSAQYQRLDAEEMSTQETLVSAA